MAVVGRERIPRFKHDVKKITKPHERTFMNYRMILLCGKISEKDDTQALISTSLEIGNSAIDT